MPEHYLPPFTAMPFAASPPFAGVGPSMFGPFGQNAWFGVPGVLTHEPPTLSAPAVIGAFAMRRGQPMGPTTDQDIESVLYDALEVLSGTDDVEARCESGRVTLTGSVAGKRLKRDVGELAWAIPAVTDVHNSVTIASRRRVRHRETESQPQAIPARKQA